MNLKQIEAFVRIANNNSFSRTAKELCLTQPTVSAYITKLEEELGTQLFARTTKDVELTEDGKKIYLYAREMVELANTIQGMFKPGVKEEEEKEILIAASSIPAQYVLPRILAEYSRRYPRSRFRVLESDSADVTEDVLGHKADVGFTGTLPEGKHCDAIPFFKDELVVITPNTVRYRSLKQQKKPLLWLQDEAFVLRESGSGTRQEAMKFLRKMGINDQELNIKASFANTEAVLMSVKEGVGISLTSRLAAAEKIERNELLEFRLSENGMFRELYLITSQMRPLSESVQRMIELVKKIYIDTSL